MCVFAAAATLTASLLYLAPPRIALRAPLHVIMVDRSSSSPYERTVTLAKPLGMVLEEYEGGKGVKVESFQEGGSAAAAVASGSLDIAPGDVLLGVNGQDISSADFDSIMDTIREAESPVRLTLDDGLGQLDITANLAKSLKPEEAVLADLVVRAAVREVRRLVAGSEELQSALGTLLRVEILLGAGTRDDGRCLVRFFGIFSTSGGGDNTYSCNVAATGKRQGEGGIAITALSCAKDEGWGRTIDLKREDAVENSRGKSRAGKPRMLLGDGPGTRDDDGTPEPRGDEVPHPGTAANAMGSVDDGEDGNAAMDPAKQPNQALKAAKRAGDQLYDVVFLVWSAVIQGLGFALGLGFLINLCGYGYRVTLVPTPSLQIDTLERMREANRDARFVRKAESPAFQGMMFPGATE